MLSYADKIINENRAFALDLIKWCVIESNAAEELLHNVHNEAQVTDAYSRLSLVALDCFVRLLLFLPKVALVAGATIGTMRTCAVAIAGHQPCEINCAMFFLVP